MGKVGVYEPHALSVEANAAVVVSWFGAGGDGGSWFVGGWELCRVSHVVGLWRRLAPTIHVWAFFLGLALCCVFSRCALV